MNFDSHGDPVLTCDPEIYFDEGPAPEPDRDEGNMSALLAVVFELGQWAGQNKVREYAARIVMRQECQTVRNFARAARVSESLVHLRIREANKFLSSIGTA